MHSNSCTRTIQQSKETAISYSMYSSVTYFTEGVKAHLMCVMQYLTGIFNKQLLSLEYIYQFRSRKIYDTDLIKSTQKYDFVYKKMQNICIMLSQKKICKCLAFLKNPPKLSVYKFNFRRSSFCRLNLSFQQSWLYRAMFSNYFYS